MLDRRHDLELMKAQVPGAGGPISGAGSTEDIGVRIPVILNGQSVRS
jgi:hypothetical protein